MWNPKVKDFLEKDPDKSLISLSWSLFWRLQLIFFGIYIGFWIIIGIIGAALVASI